MGWLKMRHPPPNFLLIFDQTPLFFSGFLIVFHLPSNSFLRGDFATLYEGIAICPPYNPFFPTVQIAQNTLKSLLKCKSGKGKGKINSLFLLTSLQYPSHPHKKFLSKCKCTKGCIIF